MHYSLLADCKEMIFLFCLSCFLVGELDRIVLGP